MKKYLLFILLLESGCMLYAQDKSNRGKEFWLGYGNCISFTEPNGPYPFNNQNLALYITTEEAATVTVSVNGTSWSQVINIPANSVDVSIALPKAGADDCRIFNDGVFDKAVHVESTKPVVVYAHEYNDQLSGATMLLPVETYGYTYYSINYKQPVSGYFDKNWFYVIAGEDNTRLEITPSDTTESGILPGQTVTVTLNKGQLYNIFGRSTNDNVCDLTGSKIVSVAGADGNCHPVAMFSGSSRLVLCATDGGEAAQQQIFPASAWGTKYLTFHSIVAVSNPFATPFINFYRVIVNDASTIVKKNGVPLTGLQRNLFYEFSSDGGDYIEADKPVIVGQYTPNSNQCTGNNQSPQGDPELMFLPAIEQGIKRTRVYNTKNANITVNYLTIIIPAAGISSLRVNGVAVPASQTIAHPNNSAYTVVAKRLIGPAAQYLIESDSGFNAMIYGSGTFESYGYIAGTLINNLNSIGSIKNVYNVNGQPNTFTCPKSPFELSLKTAYRATNIKWLFSQTTGISPATDTTITNPVITDSQIINGRKYFSYNLTSQYTFKDTGIFYIPVEYSSPDIDHCSHTDKSFVTVIVKQGPVADFNYTYAGCSTDTAFFSALPDVNHYTINKYTWQFDDGKKDTAVTSQHIFAPGNHPVTMKAIADNGCINDTIKIVNTFPKPVAKFGYDRNICAGDSVLFSDSSSITTGSVISWRWNFGDGNTKVLNNNTAFYHQYNLIQNYTVALVSVSDKSCVSDSFFTSVIVNAKPQATFTAAGKFCEDSSITFIPMVTANGNTIQSGIWYFGDGSQQIVTNVFLAIHNYANAQNNIPVKFIVSGGKGCESDTAKLIITNIFPAPVADFNFTAASYCPGKDIVFTYTGGNTIQNWQWNLGNTTSTTPSPVNNRYNNGGQYPVSLKVTDINGCGSQLFYDTLTVYNSPNIDAGPSLVKTMTDAVEMKSVTTDTGIFIYQWSPADGLSSTNILRPFTNTINDMVYTIHVVGGAGNCEATDTMSVRVLKTLYIPSAFSPNGDGRHDVWNIPALSGNNAALVTIFNRWGQIIFESHGYSQPWDGSYKGVQQPTGAYYYIIQPDVRKEKSVVGYVVIVR